MDLGLVEALSLSKSLHHSNGDSSICFTRWLGKQSQRRILNKNGWQTVGTQVFLKSKLSLFLGFLNLHLALSRNFLLRTAVP